MKKKELENAAQGHSEFPVAAKLCEVFEEEKTKLEAELRGLQSGDHGPARITDLEAQARIRDLTAELHRSLNFLARIRDHLDGLFTSRRWLVGGKLGDLYLRLRGFSRPPTAEDHLKELYREIGRWQSHRLPSALSSFPPSRRGRPRADGVTLSQAQIQQSLFYRYVERISGGAEEPALRRALAASEDVLPSLSSAPVASSEPLVSVIMPTYNRAYVLDEAIRSVQEQSYRNWELLVVDDGSTDETGQLFKDPSDPRIRYQKIVNSGAAVARNRALTEAQGELIAYHDSDNIWHPSYLEVMVASMIRHQGHYCAFCQHVDVIVEKTDYKLKGFRSRPFDYEELLKKNYIDLNTFVHRRSLFDYLGGFDEQLRRQQDWDLILKYTQLRDPLFVGAMLVLYRRNAAWEQITELERNNQKTTEIVLRNIAERERSGPELLVRNPYPSITILSWDICRNHYSKAYNLAEALSKDRDVQLVGFRFFEGEVFSPYRGEEPSFETKYFEGTSFPQFKEPLLAALASLKGDVIYAVKPRFPSLGLGLLANFHFGKPLILEINDLESVVSNPLQDSLGTHSESLSSLAANDPRLSNPYDPAWSLLLEDLAQEIPLLVTHNENLHRHFGSRSYQIRNMKDETVYEPCRVDRDEARRELGIEESDVVILFGGMVRRHKGIFALQEFIEHVKDERYKLLVVSSRTTPDEMGLARLAGDRVRILPSQGRNAMARVNLAADIAVLWLDPTVTASHYQMPFKFTDAIAMGLPVIANPISDLASLGQEGYLRLVEYGDHEGLESAIAGIVSDAEATRMMTRRARGLYLRQFSYASARANMEILLQRAVQERGCLSASGKFQDFISNFYLGMMG